jgi:glycosyltransferase involved in cell wall biosynthesis
MGVSTQRKIVVLIAYWGTRGAGTKFSLYLMNNLQNLGIDVHMSMSDSGELSKILSDINSTRCSRLYIGGKIGLLSPIRYFRAKRDFKRLVGQIKPDVIVFPMAHPWDLFTSSNDRIIRLIHDANPHPGDGPWPTKRALTRRIRSGNILVALSESVSNQVYELGIPVYQFSHPAFDFGPRLEVVRDPNKVLFIGRQRRYKGGDLLAKAWRDVKVRNPQAKLVVAGQGRISKLLEEIDGIEINNHWLSEDEISFHMQSCGVAVFPYIEASQSGLIASAAKYGMKVVATPVGGLMEQVRESGGYLASEVSAKSLADSINQALSGHNSIQKAPVVCEQTDDLIQFIIRVCE